MPSPAAPVPAPAAPSGIAPPGGERAPARVRRFDIHQRLQHALVAVGFTGLVLTGWPLRAAEAGVSRALLGAFGGAAAALTWHRVFGVVLLAGGLYHALYLLRLWRRGELVFSMVPTLQDARDVVANLRFLVGLSQERPRFGRYTYWEKLDYWAEVWGLGVMGSTGIILWAPVASAQVLPAPALPIARLIHGYEALLALLAIFIWHFYNGHFRRQFFPMNRVFITGDLPAEVVRNEYGRWWDELERGRDGAALAPPPPPPPRAAPQRVRLWPVAVTGAMTGLLLGAIALWVAFGPGMDRIGPNAPAGILGPGWGGRLGLPPGAAPREPLAVTVAAAPPVPSAPVALRALAGIPLETLEQATALSCFKSCHGAQRFAATPFPHEAHLGKGIECTTCHRYAAHERAEIDETSCKECH